MDINKGIYQEELKAEAGVASKVKGKNIIPSSAIAGRNYASRVNSKAKERMERNRRSIRVMDMIQAISRLKLDGLPLGLRSKQIFRILYFRGNAMFYWDDTLDRYFFLPYSLTAEDDQNIDFYGQYTMVKPYSLNGKSTDSRNAKTGANIESKEERLKRDALTAAITVMDKKDRAGFIKGKTKEVYLGTITRIPVYDMGELEALLTSKGKEWCKNNLSVIFRDYTQQLSENNVPLSMMQQPFIDFQAEALPMMRTMMLKAAMPKLIKTSDEGTLDSLIMELDAIEDAVIEGKTAIPVTAFQDLQEIDSKNAGNVIESFMKVYEGINNIRKTFLGIPNDGAFKKNAHVLQDEQDQSQQSSDSILDDCFDNMKGSFDLVNKLYELTVTVKISDKMSGKSNVKDEEGEEPQATPDGEGGNEE